MEQKHAFKLITIGAIVLFIVLFSVMGKLKGAQSTRTVAITLGIQALTPETFERVIKENEFVFVKFFAPWCGHCKRLAPIFKDFAAEYESTSLVVAEVDCDKYSHLCSTQLVQGYPTLKLFKNGKSIDYLGERTVSGFSSFISKETQGKLKKVVKQPEELTAKERLVSNQIKKEALKSLTKSNFDSTIKANKHVFVKFFAPWCGHCQRLAPTYKELSEVYAGSPIVIAEVNCVKESKLCSENIVHGYPTLTLFSNGKKVQYNGRRTVLGFVNFIEKNTGYKLNNYVKNAPKLFYLTIDTIREMRDRELPVVGILLKENDPQFSAQKEMFQRFAHEFNNNFVFGWTTDKVSVQNIIPLNMSAPSFLIKTNTGNVYYYSPRSKFTEASIRAFLIDFINKKKK